ncbi:MAG TPA: NADPH-dependent FMN reductase [candidate division Zixibacteria bacterium]|jgi:chromate reductase, NAD(P)H dehydrogenase (quinone)|nr:NADPH-dependent FMN reductase [candidate division Zixibacteria bacterium]HBZ00558.1 NADPH-dependent FMN reductase [candidate division Zixibacteria bacterium]
MKKYNFVAISGSLRKSSYNTMALRAAQKLARENISIEQLSIADVPFYDQDLYSDTFPQIVDKLAEAIKASDAVIIVTPEYNYSIPGVLKNAIDFLSRSPKKPFDMKVIGIMGASPGMLGSARAQYHLRQVMVYLNAYVMNSPEVMIPQVNTKFSETGELLDDKTAGQIRKFTDTLSGFSAKMNGFSAS